VQHQCIRFKTLSSEQPVLRRVAAVEQKQGLVDTELLSEQRHNPVL
jgi:hypothetical protein